jgi:hypothetical protein
MKKFQTALFALALILSTSLVTLADTIHLKDGSVIRGQIIGFRDQQFTVLIGSNARGRRSRVSLYMEDVDSIEFDDATGAAASALGNEDINDASNQPAPQSTRRNTNTQPPPDNNISPDDNTGNNTSAPINNAPVRNNTSSARGTSSPTFFQINARVRGDNTSNGWTNTGLVVKRGQRLRINATGRVSLGAGRFATPAGLPTLPDSTKLMRNEATGGLIAVVGDDNDEFIFLGSHREFTATRDGVLFLGVNEGNLNDNTGAFDVVVEAEAVR